MKFVAQKWSKSFAFHCTNLFNQASGKHLRDSKRYSCLDFTLQFYRGIYIIVKTKIAGEYSNY